MKLPKEHIAYFNVMVKNHYLHHKNFVEIHSNGTHIDVAFPVPVFWDFSVHII